MKIPEENVWQQYRAIYVHIPFCKQKCLYCDFASYACFGEREMRAYTDALCHDIEVRADEAAKVAAGATIYFGGGTPSVLPIDCVEHIVATLKACSFWQEPMEATIEVNPGTADVLKLKRLPQASTASASECSPYRMKNCVPLDASIALARPCKLLKWPS